MCGTDIFEKIPFIWWPVSRVVEFYSAVNRVEVLSSVIEIRTVWKIVVFLSLLTARRYSIISCAHYLGNHAKYVNEKHSIVSLSYARSSEEIVGQIIIRNFHEIQFRSLTPNMFEFLQLVFYSWELPVNSPNKSVSQFDPSSFFWITLLTAIAFKITGGSYTVL